MTGVLVLNATFEPLSVVSRRRAVCLLLSDKVEMLHRSGCGRWRSERVVIDEPSVVRLTRYVAVPFHRHRVPSRRAVFVRDGHLCQYCEKPAETVDHVVPRSRGGEHVWDNVVAACRRCNAQKRDHLLAETTMRLHRRPGPPAPSAWVEVAAGVIPASWEQYLDHCRRRSA